MVDFPWGGNNVIFFWLSWLTGVLVHELATGKLPFESKRHRMVMFAKIMVGLSEEAEVPDGLVSVIFFITFFA